MNNEQSNREIKKRFTDYSDAAATATTTTYKCKFLFSWHSSPYLLQAAPRSPTENL